MKPTFNDQAAASPGDDPQADPASARTAFAVQLTEIINAASEEPVNALGNKRGTLSSRTFFGGRAKASSGQTSEQVSSLEGPPLPVPGTGKVHRSSAMREVAEPDEPAPTASSAPASVPEPIPATSTAVADAPTLRSRLSVESTAHLGTATNPSTENATVEIPVSPTTVAPTITPTVPSGTASRNPPQTTMLPNNSSIAPADNGRAVAQLTFGFEIVSMQLTPFFRLGSVRLKASSDVVSLHLIAAKQEENPLAAGISFRIEHVELDGSRALQSVLLKPLGESRELTTPRSTLQIDHMSVVSNGENAPISVHSSGQTSSAVQLLGTFTVAGIDFTPSFEIDSLRLESISRTVLLRVTSSNRPAAVDLPPSFDLAEVELGSGAQLDFVRVVPSASKPA